MRGLSTKDGGCAKERVLRGKLGRQLEARERAEIPPPAPATSVVVQAKVGTQKQASTRARTHHRTAHTLESCSGRHLCAAKATPSSRSFADCALAEDD